MFRSLWFWVLVLLLALAGGSIFLSRPSAPPPAPDTLVQLAGKGDVAGVQRLLDAGERIDKPDPQAGTGMTALMQAASHGQTDTVRLLLERGAYAQARDQKGNTALMHAINNGRPETFRLILDALAKENIASINVVNFDGHTALALAAMHGRTDMARALLDAGANIWWGGALDGGWDPLHRAARGGHTEIVRLLLDKGAGINSTPKSKITALMLAAENGHAQTVQLLLERGANVNAASSDGATAMSLAQGKGHGEIVHLLHAAQAGKEQVEE